VSMTPRERLLATVLFEPLDRPVHMETIGFWDETLVRWHGEGLPPEINEIVSAYLYSGLDPQLPVQLGAHEHPGFDPLFEEEVIEQDDVYTTKRDISGSLIRVFTDGSSTIPAFLDAPVKDRESWVEVRGRLDPDTPGRLEQWWPMVEVADSQPWPLIIYISGLFGTHRHLLGFKRLMISYRTAPDLLHEISRHWVDMWKSVISRIHSRRRPEMITLWEDMCYKNGPMIGPRAFEEFMAPYYRELVGFFTNELEIPVVGVDTDGEMSLLIPKFVDAGVNMLWPFEVQAGMDVLKVREQWPGEFAIWGGIDKRALAKGRDDIKAEVMRVVPSMLERGGYIPAIDHAVPPDVPLDNWRYYLDIVRAVGERTG